MKSLTSISKISYLCMVCFYCLFVLPARAQWIQQGPGPIEDGQVENLPTNNEVVGAIECVTPHPTDADILYVGAVNGGVWRTLNATDETPVWEFMSAGLPSPSIGALEFDPADATNQTLIVGFGATSAFGGARAGDKGIFRTTDGGNTWIDVDPNGTLSAINITGIAAQGNIIVVSTTNGIYRTIDTGTNWTLLNGGISNLPPFPFNRAFDIVQHPASPTTLYTNAGQDGIYQSLDMGATWAKISDATVDAALGGTLINVKLAVGSANNLFVGIVTRVAGTRDDILSGLFRTLDGGNDWATLDIPRTIEGTTAYGIHPGGSGNRHFSITTDPNNANVVYVGGDRQPAANESGVGDDNFPNSIGAEDYTGRLFRVDASLPSGNQATPITHSGTANNSAPHADSRDMDFDADGDLIQGDDGGVYKQSSPINSEGDWTSLNGNISVSEIYSGDWDAVSNIIISGLQDNGVSNQGLPTNSIWRKRLKGDGGYVAVDDISTPGFSNRYFSAQLLRNFRRSIHNSSNEVIDIITPSLIDISTGSRISGFEHLSPIKLNSQDGQRLLISTNTGLFESFDQGSTVTAVPGITAAVNNSGFDAIAYGASDNPDILYVGLDSSVLIRTVLAVPLSASTNYNGGTVQGITINPNNSQSAYVIDPFRVFMTNYTGASWTDITGNLSFLDPGKLLSIAYIPRDGNDILAVGTEIGVFISSGPNFNTWARLGTNFPVAAVYGLEYDIADKILLASTMGRGAWTWSFAERDPVDLVLALDFSGSMLDNACPNCAPKIDVLKQSVEIFMQLWKGLAVTDDRIGVVYFQSNVDNYGSDNANVLFSAINEIDGMIADINGKTIVTPPPQATAMGGGLQVAINNLIDNSRPRNVILFTDGIQNRDPGVVFPVLTIEDGTFENSSNINASVPPTQLGINSVKINTVGVGATPPFNAQLEDIAMGTGGITKITMAPNADLRQFFVEELVDMLRDFSPQLLAYRKNTLVDRNTEVFNVNSTAQKIIFKVSYDVGDKVIVRIRKGDDDVTQLAEVTDGPFYQIFSFPFDKTLLLQGPQYVGSWQVYLESQKKVDYEIALIVDEPMIDYDFSVGGPYDVGKPLRLSAKVSINGVTTINDIKVTASIDHPKEGLGELLSTIPVEGKSPVPLEPNQTLGAQKLAGLYQDFAFLKSIRPDNSPIKLEPQTSDRTFRRSFDNTFVPGIYTVTFNISGTHPLTGPFERIEKRSVIVRVGAIDLETSEIVIGKRPEGSSVVWTYDVIPKDRFGNYLGPDYGDMLMVKSPDGDVQDITDHGDGSYSFEIVVDDGMEPTVEFGLD